MLKVFVLFLWVDYMMSRESTGVLNSAVPNYLVLKIGNWPFVLRTAGSFNVLFWPVGDSLLNTPERYPLIAFWIDFDITLGRGGPRISAKFLFDADWSNTGINVFMNLLLLKTEEQAFRIHSYVYYSSRWAPKSGRGEVTVSLIVRTYVTSWSRFLRDSQNAVSFFRLCNSILRRNFNLMSHWCGRPR